MVAGGGAFQPWTFGYIGRPANGAKGLATLYDLSIDWRATPKTTISGYYRVRKWKIDCSEYLCRNDGWLSYLEFSTRW
jgi:hypothetical protein